MKSKSFSYILSLYAFLMPFEEALFFGFGSLLRLIGIVILVYGVVISRYNKIRFPTPVKILTVWYILYLISFFWSESSYWWLYFFQLYSAQILLLIICTTLAYESIDNKILYKALVLSAIFSSILLLLPGLSSFTDEGRRTIILNGRILDPNIVGSILILSFILMIDRFFMKSRKSFLGIILLLIVLIGIFLTGSRGSLISLFFGLIFYFIMRLNSNSMKKIKISNVIFLIMAVFIILQFLPDALLSRFSIYNIFGYAEQNINVHSRTTIWSYVPELVLKKPLLGYGGGNFIPAIESVYRLSASHNIFFLSVVELGIVGFSIIIGLMISMLSKGIKTKKITIFALTITLFSTGIFLDSFSFKYFWIYLIIIINNLYNNDGGLYETK